MPGYIRDRAPIQRVINRPSAGTPRAKWLNKLEYKEDLDIPTRFKDILKNIIMQ